MSAEGILRIHQPLTIDRYSGVAWALSHHPDDIEVVTSWSSTYSHNSDCKKVPTRIKFDSSGVRWGFQSPFDCETIAWFKLLLINEKDLPRDILNCSYYKAARTRQKEIGKSPVEIVASFLACLWQHSLQAIEGCLGEKFIKECRFHIVFTVPAIWPHYAHNLMREAAAKAQILRVRPCGITTLQFISEPEAAALAIVKELRKRISIKVCAKCNCDPRGPSVD